MATQQNTLLIPLQSACTHKSTLKERHYAIFDEIIDWRRTGGALDDYEIYQESHN